MSSDELQRELAGLESKFDALQPELDLTVRDPDLGVEAFVVVWNTLASRGGPLQGCGKGGTRITPTVTRGEVAMLARIMTLKNAAAGLPVGGAKSGLRADPNAPDFERTYRRFVRLCQPVLRSNGGPFGGFGFDIGGRPEHALWAVDETGKLDCFTGKPLNLGGTDYDREGIAGYGVAVAAETLLSCYDKSTATSSFAVQGLGAMGAAVFRYMIAQGANPRYVSDLRVGGTWELTAPPSRELHQALETSQLETAVNRLAKEATGPTEVDDVLCVAVDVLFPCATQDVISAALVPNINANFIVEGANRPCTPDAQAALWSMGIPVVPDIIANPGGIIAAFVEMTSTVSPEENVAKRVNPERAKSLTREKISQNVTELVDLSRDNQMQPAEVGRLMALRRIITPRVFA
jgi:glutamate dehydrogenase (NAD(P)+)